MSQYHVSWGNETMVVSCVGIDSRYSTEYSNVDFVHFVWAIADMLGFRRNALAFLPDTGSGHGDVLASPGRLLCLRHYRVASEGWMITSRRDRCKATFRENLHPYTDCEVPEEPCNCNICAAASDVERYGFSHPLRPVSPPGALRIDA
jgi:hypothetical protein